VRRGGLDARRPYRRPFQGRVGEEHPKGAPDDRTGMVDHPPDWLICGAEAQRWRRADRRCS
jgi:hypothetical protein